ncbi:alpha-1,3-mannosyl-glycoprotein 4-beta-N-acetylglucosaminyltransferase A-like, partial [Brachyistius frenatus]|uniref:alpha-1,3-mannosyl-glycoprotein 4-beta-N-acetylglucosaminyltransferase A-like n=1 Tax=Brachyistius frenatus TaxID=100188 RepID=UPI0037E89507
MRFYPFRIGCLLVFACFVSVTWIKSIPGDEGSAELPDLQTLYGRLLVAEQLGGEVSRDVSRIFEQLRNMSRDANMTHPAGPVPTTADTVSTVKQPEGNPGMQMFLQPNIYLYMPHLRHHPNSLAPNVVLTQGRRGVSMVLGIPTVKREKQSYLVNTVSSLLFSLKSSQ